MARGKNSTALFEVIHTAKKPPKSSPTVSVPTPKWWSKTKAGPTPAQSKDVSGATDRSGAADKSLTTPKTVKSEAAGRQESWLAAAAKRGVTITSIRPPEAESSKPKYQRPDTSSDEWDPTQPGATRSTSAPEPSYSEPAYVESALVEPDYTGSASAEREQSETTYPASTQGTHGAQVAAFDDVPVDVPVETEAARPAEPKVRFADRFAKRAPRHEPEVVHVPDAQKAGAGIDSSGTASTDTDSAGQAPTRKFGRTTLKSTSPEVESPVPRAIKKARSDDDAVAVDRGAGEVRFRLSFGGVVAMAFILVMLLVLTFLIGSRMGANGGANAGANIAGQTDAMATDKGELPGKTSTAAPVASTAKPGTGLMIATAPIATAPVTPVKSTGESPVKPAVIPAHVSPGVGGVVRPDVLTEIRRPRTGFVAGPGSSTGQVSSAAPGSPEVAPAAPLRTTRDAGATYVVVQSYPEQELAQKACDFLNKQGVPCTLVQGLRDWAPRDWYSVVTLQSFAKDDSNLTGYKNDVATLGPKFSKKVLNQFQPQEYVWRADSDQGQ